MTRIEGWKLCFITHSVLLIKEKVQGWINQFRRIYAGKKTRMKDS